MKQPKVIELDGSSEPFKVKVAGYEYIFEITNPSDASFQIIEVNPDGDKFVITAGAEW